MYTTVSQPTQLIQLYLVESKDHRHIVIGLDTINLSNSKCYLLRSILLLDYIVTAITSSDRRKILAKDPGTLTSAKH